MTMNWVMRIIGCRSQLVNALEKGFTHTLNATVVLINFLNAHYSTLQNSMTALIVAVKGGYTEVVKELLKRNPNVNMTDKDGNTALMIAAKEGYTEIVQDLLDAGTYVNIPDRVRACV